MEASVNEFKLMLGSRAAGIENEALTLALSDAKKVVIKDGVGINHDDFGQLQRYKAAHLLTNWGQISTMVTSESVGDVSRSYAPQGLAAGSSDSYQDKYRTLLNGIIGFKHKVA